MASRYGPGPVERSRLPTSAQRATDAFERSFAQADEERRAKALREEQRGYEEPARRRAAEAHETGLFQQGYRRGRAPTETFEEEPGGPGLGSEQFQQAFDEPGSDTAMLGMARVQMPRRPKIIAPPGAFVPGMGFSREPVTDLDLEERDRAGEPGVTGEQMMKEPRPTRTRERPRRGTQQVTEDLFFDEEQTPAAQARRRELEMTGGQAEGLGALRNLPPEQVAAIRKIMQSGGDMTDVISAMRSPGGGGGDPTFKGGTGDVVHQYDPATDSWRPSKGPGGTAFISPTPSRLIVDESGEYTRMPSRGAPGPTGVQRPPTAGELTLEQKVNGNRAFIEDVERTIDLVKANPRAFGLKNAISWIPRAGDPLLQRLDPNGVKARAAVLDIAGKILHDRLGSAQSAGELMRAEGYAGAVTDASAALITKLERLIERAEQETIAMSRSQRRR